MQAAPPFRTSVFKIAKRGKVSSFLVFLNKTAGKIPSSAHEAFNSICGNKVLFLIYSFRNLKNLLESNRNPIYGQHYSVQKIIDDFSFWKFLSTHNKKIPLVPYWDLIKHTINSLWHVRNKLELVDTRIEKMRGFQDNASEAIFMKKHAGKQQLLKENIKSLKRRLQKFFVQKLFHLLKNVFTHVFLENSYILAFFISGAKTFLVSMLNDFP